MDELYYVGLQEEVQEHINNAKKSVEVLKNLNKVEIPDGVEVENKTGTDIIVNGDTVKDDETIMVDKVPTSTVTYSNDGKWTNQDVIVTIQVSEPVEDIQGWTKIEPLTYTKTYCDNALEIIKLKDMTGNTAEVKVDVKNIDKQAPEIRGVKDVTIVQGEAFDELAGITAYDAESGEIKDIKVTLLSRAIFDTNLPGVYSLEYTATDLANNTTSVQRKVTVNPKMETINHASNQCQRCNINCRR